MKKKYRAALARIDRISDPAERNSELNRFIDYALREGAAMPVRIEKVPKSSKKGRPKPDNEAVR
jgi:hypothetical protein